MSKQATENMSYDEKINTLSIELLRLFEKSHRLEEKIKKNLYKLGYPHVEKVHTE